MRSKLRPTSDISKKADCGLIWAEPKKERSDLKIHCCERKSFSRAWQGACSLKGEDLIRMLQKMFLQSLDDGVRCWRLCPSPDICYVCVLKVYFLFQISLGHTKHSRHLHILFSAIEKSVIICVQLSVCWCAWVCAWTSVFMHNLHN